MQHFDHWPVRGHRAAGGKADRKDRGGNHKPKHDNTASHNEIAHRPHTVNPAAMIVKRGARHLVGQRLAHGRDIRLRTGREFDDDDARDGKIADREAGADPRFKKLRRFLF